MAYSKHTLNDILTSLSYRYGESTVPASGIENRYYWINRGVEYCVERLNMTKSVSVTVASGVCALSTSSTADPAYDYKSFFKLTNSSGTTYELVNKEEYALHEGNVCSISGDHSTGYTLSVKSDGVYTLYYYFMINPMTSTTDVCIIPDPEAIAAYAYAQIRMSETDPLEDADKNMQEVETRIGAMSENMTRNEGTLTFKVLY